jgi:hypothetical protein
LSGTSQFRVGRAKQDNLAVEGRHCSSDRGRQVSVADGHVEQRAVWLDVLEPHTFRRRHTRNRRDLIEHEIFDVVRIQVHIATTETDEIRKAGMRTNGNA